MYNKRWLEVQFYYICYDMYKTNNEFFDLMDYIQLAYNLRPFNIQIVQDCAQRVLTFPVYRPYKPEAIFLADWGGMRQKDIKAYFKLNDRDYYRHLNKYISDKPYLINHFKDEELEEIQKFVNFHNFIKGVGFNGVK